jgi:dephospho-CoA kinase
VAAFGPEIIGADGEVVRPELAKRAFVSPEKTALLNATTHPRLIEEAKRRLAGFEEDGALATIIEISPYDGPDGSFGVFTDMADAVVAVVAPDEVRVQRAVGRGFAEADVRNRMARQASDDERRRWATHVVVNDSTIEALRWEVEEIWDSVVL